MFAKSAVFAAVLAALSTCTHGLLDGDRPLILGGFAVRVEGVDQYFTVDGRPCGGAVDGECPGAQEGLPFGSYCTRALDNVRKCVPCSPDSYACRQAIIAQAKKEHHQTKVHVHLKKDAKPLIKNAHHK
ncbi:hypothetical protein PINS_up012587 [Pythium insidiosum]|nr:hypothetical protein PINS_up012587 [Pythium insidiosum]